MESFAGFTLSVPATMNSWNQKQPLNSGSSTPCLPPKPQWRDSLRFNVSGSGGFRTSRGSRGTKAFANCQLDFFKCCPQLCTQSDTDSPKISWDEVPIPSSSSNVGPRTNCLPLYIYIYMFHDNAPDASDASEMSRFSHKMMWL